MGMCIFVLSVVCFQGRLLKVELLDQKVSVYIVSLDIATFPFRRLCQFAFLPAV